MSSFGVVRDGPNIGAGDLLLRKYRVEGVIGRGGTSVVFAARHEQLGTAVAIKVLTVHVQNDERAARRFFAEARAAAALRTPHVTQVIDVDVDELGRHCLVMELLQGRDLSAVIRDESPLPVERAVGFVSQVCAGMETAHAAGILHRDLKPQNLFLTTAVDGAPLVKILDFGVSKIINDPTLRVTGTSTTDTGALLGTPLYMSPERLRASAEADARADVWALGTILFELLTAERPFTAATLPQLIAALLSEDPPASLVSRRRDVPAALGEVVAACLQKDVALRMPSVAHLREALRPWTPDWGLGAAQVEPATSLRPNRRPRGTALRVGALVAGVALALFGSRLRLHRSASTAAPVVAPSARADHVASAARVEVVAVGIPPRETESSPRATPPLPPSARPRKRLTRAARADPHHRPVDPLQERL